MGVEQLQPFATELRGRQKLSRKTVVNVLSAVFAVFRYARRCGLRVPNVGFKDLELGSESRDVAVPFFTRDEAARIIDAAKEPYKTLFAVAWATGMRAGEILALTRGDLDFERRTIRVNKSSDDKTREIRQPKTRNSVALLPMPSALESAAPRVSGKRMEAEREGLALSEPCRHSAAQARVRSSVRFEASFAKTRDR